MSGLVLTGFKLKWEAFPKKLRKLPEQRQQHSQMLWDPWTWCNLPASSWARPLGVLIPNFSLPCCHLDTCPLKPQRISFLLLAAFCIFFLQPQNCRTVQAGRGSAGLQLKQGQHWSQISLLRAFPVTCRKPSGFLSPNSWLVLNPPVNFLLPGWTRSDPSAPPRRTCSSPPWWPSTKLSPVYQHFTCTGDPNLHTASQLRSNESPLNGNNHNLSSTCHASVVQFFSFYLSQFAMGSSASS